MVMPYLHFNGECENAFKFYEKVFDGKIRCLSRNNNDPESKVMHAEVMLTETGGISGSDSDNPLEHNSDIQIIVHLSSREQAERISMELSEGGKIIGHFIPHPPPDDSSGSAMLVDKYGITWILAAMID